MERYRVDLLVFHRRLRSLDRCRVEAWQIHSRRCTGQMNLYLNYAREPWTNPGENSPIGLILCSGHDAAVALQETWGAKCSRASINWRLFPPRLRSRAGLSRPGTKQVKPEGFTVRPFAVANESSNGSRNSSPIRIECTDLTTELGANSSQQPKMSAASRANIAAAQEKMGRTEEIQGVELLLCWTPHIIPTSRPTSATR